MVDRPDLDRPLHDDPDQQIPGDVEPALPDDVEFENTPGSPDKPV